MQLVWIQDGEYDRRQEIVYTGIPFRDESGPSFPVAKGLKRDMDGLRLSIAGPKTYRLHSLACDFLEDDICRNKRSQLFIPGPYLLCINR